MAVMFSAVKSLFSSEKLLDNVSSGIDKAFHTTEEKRENFNTMLALYQPFKIAQRYLAMIFCIPYAILFLFVAISAMGTFIAGFWFPNTEPMWGNIDKMLDILKGDIGTIVFTIVVFYFGGGALEGVVERIKGARAK
jgi:hypothetical protein